MINKKQFIIILLGALIFFACYISGMFYKRTYTPKDMELSENMNEDGTIYEGNEETVMYGPYASLQKGSYRVTADYEAENDNTFKGYCNEKRKDSCRGYFKRRRYLRHN